MSKYGTGMLGGTIKKIQRRKMAMKEAMGAARKTSAPAKGKVISKPKPVVKNKNVKGKAMPRTSPDKAAAQKAAIERRVAARVASTKNKKKPARTLRKGMR